MADKKPNRSGVALIIVLGLVAILMIISVAFSIHMRVERAGAANLRHGAEARLAVKGGMAAALAAIDREVGKNVVPRWFDTNDVENVIYSRKAAWLKEDGSGRVWQTTNFWKGTFVSFDTNALEHVPATIFTSAVEDYFPSGLAYRGFASKYLRPGTATGGTAIQQPEWMPIYSDVNNSDVMGRYAFLVLDTTGMLDAGSLATGGELRWMGRTPSEIAVTGNLLPEVDDDKQFADQNAEFESYTTLAEFQKLNTAIVNNSSFNTFSYDPGPTNKLINIGLSANDLKGDEKKWKIIDAFYDCGLTASSRGFSVPGHPKASEQACWAYLGLIDFVDEHGPMYKDPDIDIEPWDRPVTEAMPVMSGFIAKYTVDAEQEIEENGEVESGEHAGEKAWRAKNECKMMMSADFKIPFVFPFLADNSYRDIPGLALKARAEVNFESAWRNADLRALATELRNRFESYCNKEIIGECGGSSSESYVRIATNTSWRSGVALDNGAPPPLDDASDSGCSLLFQVAGATYVNADVQHRFPPDSEDYADQGGEPWMTVPFGPKDEGFNFGDREEIVAKRPDNGEEARKKDGTTLKIGRWKATVTVWAEFVDPKFASKDMNHESGNGYTANAFMYYRTSYLSPKRNYPRQNHFDVPTTELKTDSKTRDYFNAFSIPADPFGPDGHPHGQYFKGVPPFEGASPVASYFLTHPGVAGAVYHMNMDGVRNMNEDTGTADQARLQWRSYVKNGTLESVGELAYLPIGPWYTIRLYDYDDEPVDFDNIRDLVKKMVKFNHLPIDDDDDMPAFHPVLDHFTVLEENPRGRINLNSLNNGVLATAFHLMPVATEKGASPIKSGEERYRIDLEAGAKTDSLDLLAKAVLAYREDENGGGGAFRKLSDLGKILRYGDGAVNRFHGNGMSYAAKAIFNVAEGDNKYGEFERESIIRNSCGLFTVRGQTFIVVVRGESYSPLFGRRTSLKTGTTNAAKTAIAQVWRDTVPDKNGNYPMFVQFFKIIDD